ncbi:MAG TPA: YggT family protein [Hyphomicrobiaceae bacterium]|nr:YggT family protein [Hyphomicrobiaceae bacterium]
MIEVLPFVHYIIQLYIYVIIASAVFSWLVVFKVVNPHNQMVRSFWQMLVAVTEPLLGPIRRLLPDLGGIDISPVILIVILMVIQSWLLPTIAGML